MRGRVLLPGFALAGYVLAFVLLRLAATTPSAAPFDMDQYFIPAMALIRSALARGELPLWNPYQLAGSPFLALHSPGALYPLLLIFSPLPPHLAVTAHVIAHLLLAGLFTYGLCRRIGLDRPGSLTACFAFMGSYQVVGAAVQNTAYLSTFAWVPAIFWAVRRIASDPRAINGTIFAVVLSLGFLSGFSQGYLYMVQAAFLYAAYLLLAARASARAWRRAVLLYAGSGLLALGLVSAQLLPTLEHASIAMRNLDGLTLEQASLYGLGNATVWRGLLGLGAGFVALPILFLPLVTAALLDRRLRRETSFWLLLFLLTLDFMRGRNGFVFPLYFQLPLGDLFRIPLRIGFLMEFAAALLLGAGVSAALSRLGSRRLLVAIASVAFPIAMAADAFVRNPQAVRFDPLVNAESLYEPRTLAAFAPTARYDRIFVTGPAVPVKFGQMHGMFVVPDYDPMLPGLYGAFFGIPPETIWHGQLTVIPSDRSASDGRKRLEQRFAAVRPELLDLMSVRYYVDGRPRQAQLAQPLAPLIDGTPVAAGPLTIYERGAALPRTYLVHSVVQVASDAEALEQIQTGTFDRRSSVVVQEAVAPLEPARPGSIEHAEIVEYEARRVRIDADCDTSCLLVLTDLFDPGWRVSVDGAEAPLLRLNFLFRGVHLPPGRHDVAFEYAPISFTAGVVLSLTCALLGIGTVATARWRRG